MTETAHKISRVMEIPTTKEKFFLEYLMIKKPIFNSWIRKMNNGQWTKDKPPELNDMPMRVLAQLLYWNNHYSYLPVEERNSQVFDYRTKVKIMDKLDISEDNLNAYFSQLRKINVLEGKSINNFFVVYPEDSAYEVTFKFKINEEPGG